MRRLRPVLPLLAACALGLLAGCAPSGPQFRVNRPLRAGPQPGDTFGLTRPPGGYDSLPAHPLDPAVQPGVVMIDRAPRLADQVAFRGMLASAYPAALESPPQNLEVRTLIFIDETGRVIEAILHESSGSTELDRAALTVVRYARFLPAALGQTPLGVWVLYPVQFTAPGG